MNDANPRQQIVDSIKNNNNVLVTVSTNPSVDELSAALGLTILLNNLGKRGTAVVSGQIPPAINFLEPGKTFEDTTDSLRDFIIALDKEKADHLRYKVEGDVVKIFITPYRTQLSEKDLEFSLGDYNVEVVVALGVQDQDHLDKALDAQGAILHDATVVTLTAGEAVSTLGSINWQDQTASSLCEMLVDLSDALKEDKPLLDQQTSTAFLTGIVSATDRFSNDHTSSRVMTMAAQLMAAGANQQLIAAKLQEAHAIGVNTPIAAMPSLQNADGTISLSEGAGPAKLNGDQGEQSQNPSDGMIIEIDHPEEGGQPISETKPELPLPPELVPPLPETPPAEAQPAEATFDESNPAESAEQTLARELAEVVPPKPEQPPEALGQELANAEVKEAPQQTETLPPQTPPQPVPELPKLDFEALLPKTEPAEPNMPNLPNLPSNTDITTHADSNYIGAQSPAPPAVNGAAQPDPSSATVDPFAGPMPSSTLPPLQPDPLFAAQHASTAPVAAPITPPHAPDEIQYEESPIPNDPAAVAAVPDFAALNPTGLASTPAPATVPAPSTPASPPSLDTLPPPPPLPPLPDLSTPPPPPDLSLPPAQAAPSAPSTPPTGTPPPDQFQIPSQK